MVFERLVQHTLKIQAIPAPTFDETQRAAFLHAAFLEAGVVEVSLDEVGNVLARIPGGPAPPLILSAHLDSVFPRETPLEARRTRSRIYGPGVGDNAVSLAALVELAYEYANLPPAGDVWLIANVQEEGLGDLKGMRRIVERFGREVSAYIILEGMALGLIYNRALPVLRLHIAASAEGGHSWIHAGRASAVHTLTRCAGAILTIPLPGDPKTILNIGRIIGGTSVNTIASSASMEVDLRSEDPSSLESLESELHTMVDSLDVGDADLSIKRIGVRPGGGIPADHPLVLAALRSMQTFGLSEPRLEIGSTDANIPLSLGYPAICIGLTYGGGAHSLDEFIELEPLEAGYNALTHLVEKAFHLRSQ